MKLTKMMKTVERALTAASFAEEGEFQTAQGIIAESRRVLLGLKEGQIDTKTLRYALNTAKRVNARLDILSVASSGRGREESDAVLRSFEAELKAQGVPYRLVRCSGCLKERIIDYTNREKEILFAVIESPASLDIDCTKREQALSELWRQLKCPLVVVMDGV